MRVLLVSTYELGHQPFSLAESAGILRQRGVSVQMQDFAVQEFDEAAFRQLDLIAFYVPMHTATRLASQLIPKVRRLNPSAHIAACGLYAPLNEGHLRRLGVQTILGGEFEQGLAALVERLSNGTSSQDNDQIEPCVSIARQTFVVPDRRGLPTLDNYAFLRLPNGEKRTTGGSSCSAYQ